MVCIVCFVVCITLINVVCLCLSEVQAHCEQNLMASDHWQLPGVAHFVALACAALHRGLLLSFNMFQLILE